MIVAGAGRLRPRTRTACASSATATLGFVFQFHHLLPEFTAPRERDDARCSSPGRPRIGGRGQDGAHAPRGDGPRAPAPTHRPGRALRAASSSGWPWPGPSSSRPRALLGDEPSGNLDQETGERLHGLLRRLNQEKGITVVVVTHNDRLAAACDRVLRLEGGRPARHLIFSGGASARGGHNVSP